MSSVSFSEWRLVLLNELQTQFQLLIDLNFISESKTAPIKELLTEIQKCFIH